MLILIHLLLKRMSWLKCMSWWYILPTNVFLKDFDKKNALSSTYRIFEIILTDRVLEKEIMNSLASQTRLEDNVGGKRCTESIIDQFYSKLEPVKKEDGISNEVKETGLHVGQARRGS